MSFPAVAGGRANIAKLGQAEAFRAQNVCAKKMAEMGLSLEFLRLQKT